jgi:hypothetical protein
MNRRKFLQQTIAATAVLSLYLAGCGKLTTTTAAALAQVLGSATAELATLLGNTALASQIDTATTKLVGLINTWVTGSTTANIIAAINDLMVLIQSVEPLSPEITGLVTLALGTIQAILALFPPTTSPSIVAPGVRAANLSSIGITHVARNEQTFRQQWNMVLAPIAAANPKFQAAKL